jgi:hypothetical protein
MKLGFRQIYIRPGASLPFSHHMQHLLRDQLSAAEGDAEEFVRRHGQDFKLVTNISAEVGTKENQIKGPTMFKRTRDVEYSLFLPYDAIAGASAMGRHVAAEFLLDGIRSIFQQAGVGVTHLDEKRGLLIERICSDPSMLSEPWPWPQQNQA